MLEAILELLFEIFGEVMLQVIFEVLTEVGIHLTRGHTERVQTHSQWRLLLGYPLLGAMAGGLSLLVFSHSLAHSHGGRLATLVLAPVLAAASTVAIGHWRARRGQQVLDIDRIAYAYLFALGMAVVRFKWAG
jgi:hydrogenase maturation factor